MITLISTPPSSVSPEEHRQIVLSTPSSFSDIPPVLRHKQDDVSIELDPPIDGLSLEELAKGTLYVVENVLAFISTSSGRGFHIQYPSITIHAVSRSGSSPIVYCQLESQSPDADAEGGEGEDEDLEMTELKIRPADPSSVDNIFEALSFCAALHPDPNISRADNDDEGLYHEDLSSFETFTGGPEEELSEVGRAALAHLESIIVYPEGFATPLEPVDSEPEGAEALVQNADDQNRSHSGSGVVNGVS